MIIVVLAVIFQPFHWKKPKIIPPAKKTLLNLVIHSSEVNMEKLEVLAMKSEVTRADGLPISDSLHLLW